MAASESAPGQDFFYTWNCRETKQDEYSQGDEDTKVVGNLGPDIHQDDGNSIQGTGYKVQGTRYMVQNDN